MKLIDNLKQRRTYYNLNKKLPVSKSEVKKVIEEITELVPDAFNMKSARVLVVMDKKQDELWDKIFDNRNYCRYAKPYSKNINRTFSQPIKV